jgi:hypothetical protein
LVRKPVARYATDGCGFPTIRRHLAMLSITLNRAYGKFNDFTGFEIPGSSLDGFVKHNDYIQSHLEVY